jgi:hypothetical protein
MKEWEFELSKRVVFSSRVVHVDPNQGERGTEEIYTKYSGKKRASSQELYHNRKGQAIKSGSNSAYSAYFFECDIIQNKEHFQKKYREDGRVVMACGAFARTQQLQYHILILVLGSRCDFASF